MGSHIGLPIRTSKQEIELWNQEMESFYIENDQIFAMKSSFLHMENICRVFSTMTEWPYPMRSLYW